MPGSGRQTGDRGRTGWLDRVKASSELGCSIACIITRNKIHLRSGARQTACGCARLSNESLNPTNVTDGFPKPGIRAACSDPESSEQQRNSGKVCFDGQATKDTAPDLKLLNFLDFWRSWQLCPVRMNHQQPFLQAWNHVPQLGVPPMGFAALCDALNTFLCFFFHFCKTD